MVISMEVLCSSETGITVELRLVGFRLAQKVINHKENLHNPMNRPKRESINIYKSYKQSEVNYTNLV